MQRDDSHTVPIAAASPPRTQQLVAEERVARDDDALLREWAARPPGRHGRMLLVEIERYLEFFAIARGAA